MKKFLVGLLTVALAASMLVGCGKKEEKKKADNSLKDVQSKKELILGLDASFPPMGFTDKKDNIVGFDIDLAKEVCKRLGVELKLQPISWKAKEMELSTKKIDCIWNGMSVDDDRIEGFNLSKPYIANKQIIITSENSGIKTKPILQAKRWELRKALPHSVQLRQMQKHSIPLQISANMKAMMKLILILRPEE